MNFYEFSLSFISNNNTARTQTQTKIIPFKHLNTNSVCLTLYYKCVMWLTILPRQLIQHVGAEVHTLCAGTGGAIFIRKNNSNNEIRNGQQAGPTC